MIPTSNLTNPTASSTTSTITPAPNQPSSSGASSQIPKEGGDTIKEITISNSRNPTPLVSSGTSAQSLPARLHHERAAGAGPTATSTTTVQSSISASMSLHGVSTVLITRVTATSFIASATPTSATAAAPSTTNRTPMNDPALSPTPTQPGITPSCTKYNQATTGDTCNTFASKNNITLAQLFVWNIAFDVDHESCKTSLWAEYHYCVGINDAPSLAVRSLAESSTTTRAVETIMPTITTLRIADRAVGSSSTEVVTITSITGTMTPIISTATPSTTPTTTSASPTYQTVEAASPSPSARPSSCAKCRPRKRSRILTDRKPGIEARGTQSTTPALPANSHTSVFTDPRPKSASTDATAAAAMMQAPTGNLARRRNHSPGTLKSRKRSVHRHIFVAHEGK